MKTLICLCLIVFCVYCDSKINERKDGPKKALTQEELEIVQQEVLSQIVESKKPIENTINNISTNINTKSSEFSVTIDKQIDQLRKAKSEVLNKYKEIDKNINASNFSAKELVKKDLLKEVDKAIANFEKEQKSIDKSDLDKNDNCGRAIKYLDDFRKNIDIEN